MLIHASIKKINNNLNIAAALVSDRCVVGVKYRGRVIKCGGVQLCRFMVAAGVCPCSPQSACLARRPMGMTVPSKIKLLDCDAQKNMLKSIVPLDVGEVRT